MKTGVLQSSQSRIGFLFGAGVSLAAGAPSTKDLTDLVLQGRGVRRHTGGCYFIPNQPLPDLGGEQCVERIRCFVQFLAEHANRFFREQKRNRRTANYEDIHYLASQLADAVEEYENPAVEALLRSARSEFAQAPFRGHAAFEPNDIFKESRNYIKSVVSEALFRVESVKNHLDQLVQANRDDSISRVEVVSLNHDLLIERTLKQNGVQLATGFTKLSEYLLQWNRDEFARSRSKVRLNKLHGSVDWISLRTQDRRWRTCIVTCGDISMAKDPRGHGIDTWDPVPEILVGTFNKMLEYTMGIYADLFCAFRVALRQLDKLVVAGYSFGDKGVNAALSEWIRENQRRRIMIVSPHASRFQRTARGAIRKVLEDCRTQITLRNARFEDVAWGEIREWRTMGVGDDRR